MDAFYPWVTAVYPDKATQLYDENHNYVFSADNAVLMINLLPEWQVNPVVTSTPSAADLYAENFQNGTEFMAEERWQEAVEAFLVAIESNPENDRIHLAYNGLGLAYDQLEQLDLAVNHFDQAITRAPNVADYYAN